MKFDVRINGIARAVEIDRDTSGKVIVRLDGVPADFSAVETGANAYSLLLGGRSFDVQVLRSAHGLQVRCGGREFHVEVSDPRAWRGGRGAVQSAEGRQQVTSPMPGKVVRVLVAAGDSVEARQGLIVVEAMKMQNEIRSPKSGSVERVFVSEGQTVAAGETLVSIA